MVNIKIDITSVVQTFSLQQVDISHLRQLVANLYANEAYRKIIERAQRELVQTRNEYLEGLSLINSDEYTYLIRLSGVLPNMIEQGAPAFDMKKGFQNSSKAKRTKKGGWYLIIPFTFRTTSANPLSGNPGQLLPRSVYDLIRNEPDVQKQPVNNVQVSLLKNNDKIPARYQPPQSVIERLTNTANTYIPKSSIYAGLIRTKNVTTNRSKYNTFRAVSNNSDPASWQHPGFSPHLLMDQAVEEVDREDIITKALEKLFDEI